VDVARVRRLLGDRGPFGRSLAAIVLVAAWVATWRPQVDPDAWWHLAFGDAIATTGAIPTAETFSWLTAGDRIVLHSWLWELLLAGAYRLAGATGTSLLILPVTAAIVALLWWLLRTVAPGTPPLARALAVLAAAVAALPAWAPRAQTLDAAFVLVTVSVLARYVRDGERRPLLALPVIGLLWANFHGSAILALPATVVLALFALPIGARLGDRSLRSPLPVLGALAAALVAASINPYGPRLLLYPVDRTVASAFIPEIVEWRPPDLTAPGLLAFAALIAVAIAVSITRRGRPDTFILITAGTWTLAALWSVRFLAIAACLLVVAVAATVRAGRDAAEAIGGGSPSERELARSQRRPLWAITGIAAAAILAAGWLLIVPSAQDAAMRHRLPVAAVAALDASGCPGRLLVDYGWGGYVIWTAHRTVGAYGNSAERAVRDQLAVELAATDPAGWLQAHDVEIVLLPRGGPLSRWLDGAPGWQRRYEDDQATIHVRQGGEDCALGGQAVASVP
jgi:hypothetical protein